MPRTFTLLRTLGRGAHGAVHLAEVRDEEDYVQTLAVKRLLPQWSDDADLVARLKDEARLLALLRHDHVVRVHGLTRIDGALAILMEPVEGMDLGTLGDQVGSLPPRVALQLVEAVADALDAAWCTVPPGQDQPLQVVHRDIKPSNVMVTPRGAVKVMDFGVARARFDTREGETLGQQYGTARYMAPERWLHGEAGHASDVFALGITLCEVAAGRRVARPRLSPELFAEDLAEATRGLSPDLAALVASMTAFDPAARPTAAQVAERCRELLVHAEGPSLRVWAASHVRPSEGAPLDPTATGSVVAEESVTREPVRVPAIEGRGPVIPAWLPVAVLLALLAVPVGRRLAPEPHPDPARPAPSVQAAVPDRLAGELQARGPDPDPAGSVEGSGPRPAPEPPPRPAGLEVAPGIEGEATREPGRPLAPPRPLPVEATPPVAPEGPEGEVRVPVRFTLDPGLVAETDGGRIARSPQVVHLPALRTLEVRVEEGDRRWTCQITTGSGLTEVRVRAGDQAGCSQ